MLPGSSVPFASLILVPTLITETIAFSNTPDSQISRRYWNPLGIDLDPAPSPEDGPPFSANALRDPAFLPAQIGGIVGAYALSLILVAITLFALAKRRREQLSAANDEADFDVCPPAGETQVVTSLELKEGLPVPNFSYPSPQKAEFGFEALDHSGHQTSSPTSSIGGPGVNPFVDPKVVAADRAMAQNQLEEMYKHVMQHEEAKHRGTALTTDFPLQAAPPATSPNRRERVKPASLNLAQQDKEEGDRPQSRTSSLLSNFRSKRKASKGLTISSPMMTPQSATFPRLPDPHGNNEPPTPRHYAPSMAAPAARDHGGHGPSGQNAASSASNGADQSPESILSIDERLGLHFDKMELRQGKAVSQAYTEPPSAVSANSQAPLIGLPSSPRITTSFASTLPSSPKPGATFPRSNGPSAVRTGGSLPLRAYEPSISTPTSVTHSTKQTVFERKGPLSPTMGRTPGTAMPYSPYQPFTPCVPVTPSLVTKEERKRMKRAIPKTPTLEMVKNSEDIW